MARASRGESWEKAKSPFATRLWLLMNGHPGTTQAQLADKIGISRSALAMWEIGTTEPDISKLKSLCSVLNVSERDLLINVSEWHSDMFEDFYNVKFDYSFRLNFMFFYA